MNIKKFYEEYSYRYVCTLSLSAVILLYANELLGSILHPGFIFFSIFFFCSLAVFIDAFKKKFVLIIIAVASLIVLIVILQFLSLYIFQILSESTTWMLYSRDPYEPNAFRNAVISGGIAIVALVFFVFSIIRFYRVRLTLGITLLITTIVLAIFEEPVSIASLFLLFLFLLLVFYEFIVGGKKAITYLIPFVLIMTLVISIIPSSEQRIPWYRLTQPATDFFGRTVRRINDLFPWGEGTEFGVSFIGFTDDGRIRGRIIPSEGEALLVTGNPPHRSFYLTGTIMDTYTGAGWERRQNMDHFDYPEINLEALELLLALYRHDALFLEDGDDEWITRLLEVNVLDIQFLDIRTRSIFHPLRTFSVSGDSRMNLAGSNLLFNSPQESDTGYSLRYLSFNYNHEIFENLLVVAGHHGIATPPIQDEINAGEFFNYFNQIPELYLPAFPIPVNHIAVLEQRREFIHYYYTALPDTVPDRVHQFAIDITEEYHSNYEKMRAIEGFFLEGHFSYTTTPPPVPQGDFVDWFIFEGTSGYCTYFATAAAVLGRSVGIPVRYVQGFAVPASDEEVTVVRNLNAHAWIEAYIDYIGWIPFEPTPTFDVIRQNTWRNEGQLAEASEEVFQESNIGYNRWEPDMQLHEEIIEDLEPERVYLTVIAIAFGILAIIVLGLLLSGYLYFLKRRQKLQKADIKRRFIHTFKEILYLFDLQGISIKSGETLKEFSAGLGDEEFGKIVGLHEKIVYAKSTISPRELEVTGEYRDSIVKRIGKIHLKIRYWFYISK